MAKEGYLTVDHRASPGIPADAARKMGLDPSLVGEGKLYEAATKKCAHCPSVFIMNPLRTRERAYCMQCGGAYICDSCNLARSMPDYVHHSAQEIVEKVASGKFIMTGTTSLPVLTRKE